jgi:hypothetical protein
MTKTEQNRVLAWRLKVLREASATKGSGTDCYPSGWLS